MGARGASCVAPPHPSAAWRPPAAAAEEQASAYEELRPAGTLGALFWRSRSAGLEVPGAVFYHAGASLGPEEAKAAGLAPGELPSNYSAYVRRTAGRRRTQTASPAAAPRCAATAIGRCVEAEVACAWPQVEEWAEEAALAVEQGFIVRARVDQDTRECCQRALAC